MNTDTKIQSWMVSPVKTKKYRVILSNGKKVDFGSSRHEQYRDSTPLKVYQHLDHRDTRRKELYYLRHKIDYPIYTADWLSKTFLWN